VSDTHQLEIVWRDAYVAFGRLEINGPKECRQAACARPEPVLKTPQSPCDQRRRTMAWSKPAMSGRRARALRAVFSSHDNWLNLSEAERDEWRGYFDRMLEWLRHFGYTPERNPWSMLLEGLTCAAASADEGAP
jgi:hypothetical protein